jgi:hypothetical protein
MLRNYEDEADVPFEESPGQPSAMPAPVVDGPAAAQAEPSHSGDPGTTDEAFARPQFAPEPITLPPIAAYDARATPAEPAVPPPVAAPVSEPVVDRPVARQKMVKMAIAGGRQTGKSYLFQSIVLRTWTGFKAGALAGFLDDRKSTLVRMDGDTAIHDEHVIDNYKSWGLIPPTQNQVVFRVKLTYPMGWFGVRDRAIELSFVDAPGEDWSRNELAKECTDTDVMVLCVPAWAAFPAVLSESEESDAAHALTDFHSIVYEFSTALANLPTKKKVQMVVALTMADDGRSALDIVRTNWIEPFTRGPIAAENREALHRQSGLSSYLAAARRVSDFVELELKRQSNNHVNSIPGSLRFGGTKPWFIPVSAIDGARLMRIVGEKNERERQKLVKESGDPVPAHVELPLLIALCQQTNALM